MLLVAEWWTADRARARGAAGGLGAHRASRHRGVLSGAGVPVYATRRPSGGFELLDSFEQTVPPPPPGLAAGHGRLRRVRVRIAPGALRLALVDRQTRGLADHCPVPNGVAGPPGLGRGFVPVRLLRRPPHASWSPSGPRGSRSCSPSSCARRWPRWAGGSRASTTPRTMRLRTPSVRLPLAPSPAREPARRHIGTRPE